MARGRTATKERVERKERVPFGQRKQKLSLNTETHDFLNRKGLVPRWFNDTNHGQRLQDAISAGYQFVMSDGEVKLGDSLEKADMNKHIRRLVGTNKDGSPLYAYLLAIKKKWYDEDQAKKEERNKMVDDAIRAGNPAGNRPGDTYTKDPVTGKTLINYEP